MRLIDLVKHVWNIPHRIGGKAERYVYRKCKIDTYELRDGWLIRQQGLTKHECIDLESLLEWWIIPEMTFDLVYLRLKDARLIRWIDVYGDLTAILRETASQLEREGYDT